MRKVTVWDGFRLQDLEQLHVLVFGLRRIHVVVGLGEVLAANPQLEPTPLLVPDGMRDVEQLQPLLRYVTPPPRETVIGHCYIRRGGNVLKVLQRRRIGAGLHGAHAGHHLRYTDLHPGAAVTTPSPP